MAKKENKLSKLDLELIIEERGTTTPEEKQEALNGINDALIEYLNDHRIDVIDITQSIEGLKANNIEIKDD